jgi:hypothetical protein
MQRMLFLLLVLIIGFPHAVRAEAPLSGFGQQLAQTVTPNGVFFNPSGLTANAGRQACLIQYLGATTGFVFFGPAAPVGTATSFQLANKSTIACGSADGTVDSNAVWVAGQANDVFVYRVK